MFLVFFVKEKPQFQEQAHQKTVISDYNFKVRLLCIDNKEFIFVNAAGTSILENKDKTGNQKECNY